MRTRLVTALLPCVSAACMTVRPVIAPASFVTQRQPEVVWVSAADHAAHPIPLGRPAVVGDSLQGLWLGTGERLTLPLSGVQMVARQPDTRRTVLLVAGAALAAGFIAWRATDDRGPQSGCVFDPRSGWYCP